MRTGTPTAGRAQAGFTLIEVLVSATLLVATALGALQVMDGASRTNYRAEQSQVAIDRAQAELEQLRALDFDRVALSGPAPSTAAGGPGDRLAAACTNQGVSLNGCLALNEDGSNRAPLVVEGGALESGDLVVDGAVSPGPDRFTSGDVSGSIYRYVVWQNDYACPPTQCPGLQDSKRVAVVVTLDEGAGGARAYREIQSDFFDPDAGKDIEPQPSPAEETSAQQLWLTDTRCSVSLLGGPVDRTLFDHPLHNTLGRCDGDNEPDLLATTPPPLNEAFPAESQPEFDLSTDVEPLIGGDQDKGLQIRTSENSGCSYAPTGLLLSPGREQTHRWVSEPVEQEENPSGFVLEGDATLALWTQTVGGVGATARICIYVFIRDEGDLLTEPTDTLLGDANNGGAPYFTYEANEWPQGGWAVASVPMRLQPPPGESVVRVLPGQRLGVAISVEASTSVDMLQFSYEHPDFDSRLEVETATPLP